MATKEELFAAVRMIKEHCKKQTVCIRRSKYGNEKCVLAGMRGVCVCYGASPFVWPDPEEGGGEDG